MLCLLRVGAARNVGACRLPAGHHTGAHTPTAALQPCLCSAGALPSGGGDSVGGLSKAFRHPAAPSSRTLSLHNLLDQVGQLSVFFKLWCLVLQLRYGAGRLAAGWFRLLGRSKRPEWLHHLRGQVGAAERQGLVSSSPMCLTLLESRGVGKHAWWYAQLL